MTNTLFKLKTFVESFNSGELQIDLAEQQENYIKEVKISCYNQFCSPTKRTHIGLSEIGKPAVLLGLKALGVSEVVSPASKLRFHFGDVFEALIVQILISYGLEVTDVQKEVAYSGIPGHIDGIVNGDTVLEVKTMSDSYYQRFTKQPDDSRGYLTQLNFYCHLLGLKGVWLCINKQTYELALIELIPDPTLLERGKKIIQVLPNIVTINDVLDNFDAPEPVTEFFKKQPTGKYLVPETMKYSNCVDVFYECVVEPNGYKKPTKYVVDYQPMHKSIETFYDSVGKGLIPF